MNEQDFVKLQTKTIFFRCAIPGLLAMIVSSIYVMIDGMFVGKLIGSHALAAVNLVFPKQKDIKKQPMFTCLQTKEYCY